MTRSQLEAVYDELVSMIGAQNSAAADDDRGPANDRLCLTLGDDGAGAIGRRIRYDEESNDEVEDYYEFKDLDELVGILEDYGVEFDGEDQ